MGRGDIKSKKGKIFAGSFGKSRPAKTSKPAMVKAATVVAEPVKKTATKKAK